MKMAVSEAKLKAIRKYDDKAYRKVSVRIPRELEEAFMEKCSGSVNGYIVNLIKKDLGVEIEAEKEKDPE